MGLLGQVENGWFAQMAHTCRDVSKYTLDTISFGHGWGDKLYTAMDKVADSQISSINEQAISTALQNGATQHQALSAGSAALEPYADPKNISELGKLSALGSSISVKTVKEAIVPSFDAMALLMPLLIGAGIVGGTYIAAEAYNMPTAAHIRKRRSLAH